MEGKRVSANLLFRQISTLLVNHIPKSQSTAAEIEHDGIVKAVLAIREENDDWDPDRMSENVMQVMKWDLLIRSPMLLHQRQ